MFDNWKVISTYTRADAITDGVLVDVSETAKELGFRFPVALTSGAWHEAVALNEHDEGQDEPGRLWDVLWMLRVAIRKESGSQVNYSVLVMKHGRHETVQLKSLCHPGDSGEPVITILLPHED